MTVTAHAPGRVNLMGDHTDYTDGLVFPMAIQLGITVTGTPTPGLLQLSSDAVAGEGSVRLPVPDPRTVEPSWMRYPAAVAAELAVDVGLRGAVTSTLPIAGLSSSAALQVATALALGASGDHVTLAQLCQRAEHRATGVRTGILDQLSSLAGQQGCALRIDCHTLEIVPTPMPDDVDVVVVHSGQHRHLAETGYGKRRSECEQAEALLGPLRLARPGDERSVADPTLRARARHVLTENERVDHFRTALADGDLAGAGSLMDDSHRSLRDDFEVSTPEVDRLVDRLRARPGVHGVRLTGGGFGGAVVALAEPGAIDEGWTVRPSDGARVSSTDEPGP